MTDRIFFMTASIATGPSPGGCLSGRIQARKDDETCRNDGAKPGTEVYVQCRMAAEGNRSSRRMAYAQSQMAEECFMNSMLSDRF